MIQGTQLSLTREGHVYRPVRTGTLAGGLLGAAGAFEIIAGDTFIKAANKKYFNEAVKAQGFTNSLKAIGKSAGSAALTAAAAFGAVALGSLLGNTLFDAPKNQELRDQADGIAAARARLLTAQNED